MARPPANVDLKLSGRGTSEYLIATGLQLVANPRSLTSRCNGFFVATSEVASFGRGEAVQTAHAHP